MTTPTKIIEQAAKLGIQAKLWEKGGRVRIYAQTGRKDLAVYLDCTDGAWRDDKGELQLDGAAFKVFCNTQQHPNWLRSQVAKARERYVGLFHAWVIVQYADIDPATGNDETGAHPYGPDICGMIAEAHAFAEKAE